MFRFAYASFRSSDRTTQPFHVEKLVALMIFLFFGSAVFGFAQAPSGNVVIGTSTTWSTGTYKVTSLTVNSGATLTVGGGSTITVSGAVLVTANSNIVLESINNTALVNKTWQGAGVTINAASVEVDAGSSINADGQGYVANAGPGGSPVGSSDGGSYGGLGAVQQYPIAAASPVYGSATAPTDLGSGGDLGSGSTGAAGGGAIHLTVSGTLTNNGIISATGVPPSTVGGSGAGGSVYIQTGSLTGAGSIVANGGTGLQNGAYGGGGGRVAVYYNATTSSFTGFAASTASGGGGSFSPGANGTAGFFDTSTTDEGLSVYQNFAIPSGTTVSFNSVTVQAGALLTVGGGSTVNVDTALKVTGTLAAQTINNTVQVNGVWQGAGVTFNAASVQVDATGSFNGDTTGYIPAAGPGGAPSGTNPGASFGGLGGVGTGAPPSVPSSVYGSATAPVDLGSGGSSTNGTQNGNDGGSGGGAIKLTVSGTLTDNGIISANGQSPAGPNDDASGGSGGSLFIQTATLTGTGSIQANGGGAYYGGGGGGGRVALYYTTNSGFNLDLVTANGGTGGASGLPGTVYTLAANTNLIVSDNVVLPANATLNYSSITVNNKGSLTLGSGSMLMANSVSVSNGSTFNVGGGSTVTISGALLVIGNSSVVLQSINNTAQLNGMWQGAGVTLNAASIEIDAGSSINADQQGYVPAAGPGGAPLGTNPGASFGGLGGVGTGAPPSVPSPVYGSPTAPVDLGSGGSSSNGIQNGSYGGAGGGAVRLIVSGTLANNGIVSANGQTENGENPDASGGSGGSIFIQAETLTGAGTIQANGGGAYYGGAGGGGRAAVYYTTATGFNATQVTATGGAGGSNGSNGTIVFTSTPTFAWVTPAGNVLHGTKTLQWFAGAVDFANTTVKLVASGPDVQTLGSGLGANSSLSLDTTTLANGKYEFRLIFYDENGNDIQEVPRTFVINNSLAWHSGIITSNQEWTANQVQGIDGGVIIPSGVTVTIDPGTIVKATPGSQIIVQSGGILNALGSVSSPVIFTTFDDSSVGGDTDFTGGLTLPTAGEWNGIIVQTGGQFNTNANTEILYVESSLTGSLAVSQTLLSNQVYQVNGTLVVPSGVTLTVQPGTVVKFAAGAGMDVQPGASIIANGTVAQPIYFTSLNDSSVGGNTSGIALAPAPGDWATILIDGATATFNHTQFLYGGGPQNSAYVLGMIQTSDNATVTISNSVIRQSFYNGILTGYPNGGGTLTLSSTVVSGVEDRGIDAFAGSTVNVTNDTFDGNNAGIEVHGGTVNIANTIVSNTTGTQFGGIDYYQGALNISYSDVWTSAAGVPNYSGVADPTGTNGNISANPVYVNQPQADYRLNFGSLAIDAANGQLSPLTDAFGDPRYNDPRVPTRTGVPDANGHYPDMGAFEYVESAASDIDLTVPSVTGPATAIVGTQVQLTWTDENTGSGTAQGPWHDAIYLVQDHDTNPVAIYAGDVLVASGVTLGPGASVTSTGTIRVPGSTVGNHRWEVKANDRGEVFVGQNSTNATGISLDSVAIDLPELVVDGPATSNSFAATGQSAWYKLIPGTNKAVNVTLNLAGTSGAVQLFIGQGYVPTPQHFDYQQTQFDSITASIVIPNTSSQTYYVTAYAQLLPVSPAPFTIVASTVQFSLTSVSPNAAVNSGSQTLTFVGDGFQSNGTYQLVAPGGQTYNATSVFITDAAHAAVTFAMSGLPAGTYGAQVTENGMTASLSNAVTVSASSSSTTLPNGTLTVLSTPAEYRTGFSFAVTLNYQNSGDGDEPAPMILVSATGGTISEIPPPCTGCNSNFPLMYQNASTSSALLLLGIAQQGPAGVLPAGASGSITLLATPTGSTFTVTTQTISPLIVDPLIGYQAIPGDCQITTIAQASSHAAQSSTLPCPSSTTTIGDFADAAGFCSAFLPPFTSPAGFSRTCMQLLNGSSYDYNPTEDALNDFIVLDGRNINSLLSADATALSSRGIYEPDGNRLFNFELQNDGVALFNQRYHQGAFGFGTSHAFDITGELYNSAPVIHYPDGTTRTFPTVNPTQPGQHLGNPGDYGVLTVNTDGSWTLTESNGIIYNLIPDAQSTATSRQVLSYIQDLKGNRFTLTYTNDLVTSAADNFGNTVTFVYDSLGHILQSTDPVGRVTTYTYDVKSDTLSSTFLTSITNSSGTTSLTWNEGGPSGVGYFADNCVATYCEPAIGVNTIAYPDGTHTYFTYDALGRLASEYNDGKTQTIAYSYSAGGTIALTDADGNTTQLATDENGSLSQYNDPLGSVTQLSYDPEEKLTGLIGPLGTTASFGYDALGNLASLVDPLGNQQSYSSTANNRLMSFTDAAGNVTSAAYDNKYNQTGLIYPDGSTVQANYDSHGNVTGVTNRRGHTTTYSYNSINLLTSKTYANGSQVSYTYDAHRNLLTSTASNGTTSFTYDTADRLTSVAYPNGQTIQYTYNSGGQRTSMSDSTGFNVVYTYDATGRLSQLTNGSGASIVAYTYDVAGNLTKKKLGNGTYTTYAYDADGNPLHLINYAGSGSKLSEFDYTYDALGRTVTANAPVGQSSYGYDADGEITSVTTPNAVIPYTYDVDGNWSTAAGINYSPNNLNEYTSAGAAGYTYDADGNLVSGGGSTYTYDDENRLTGTTSATDTWTYQYDGLGRRISGTHNGAVTQYVNDLSGLGNVEAELNGSGQLISHYTYGLDLTSSVPASGSSAYYHFDASGNTAQMTNSSGSIVNSYSYLPFGQKLTDTTGVTNPFTYVGEYGVMDEGSGLYYMRNRWYSPALGRFLQTDPIGTLGSESNLYRYAENSPLNLIDPIGLYSGQPDYFTIGGTFGISIGLQVNLYTGEVFVSRGVAPGLGANIGFGSVVSDKSDNRAAAVDNVLTGAGVSASIYTYAGGGVAGNAEGDVALEYGVGFGGHGPGKSFGTATGINVFSQPIQSLFSGANYLSGGSLFGVPSELHLPIPDLFNHQPGNSKTIPGANSKDPNGKLTSGFGDQGFVPPGAPILYTIYFENKATATAPAEEVVVADPLAANLDWSTVQLSQIQFNNVTINVPAGQQTYTGQVNVSTDPNPVSVNATLNPGTGVFSWTMESINPSTGGLPADPLAGFLPPNNASNQGTGYVTFTVKPKIGLADGTAITNQATIVFDANASISTNTVTNTIDSVYPTSVVAPLPANSTPSFTVTWSGSDPAGAGIASYNIFVSTNGGGYALWLPSTTATSATYTGYAGQTYSFYSIATDNVGNIQQAPGQAQTTTVVQALSAQTITFGALANQTYGVTPITLTATASSGLPLSYTVTGPATVSGSTLTITGAGSVTVTASQAGNSSYAAASPVSQSFTVAKAVLTATAANASRLYGAANPALTYTVTGFVNGDTSGVVSGSATLSTTATTTSPVSTYPITFATEALAATNYGFSYVAGTLTVSGGASQTLTFGALSNQTYGATPIALNATASSGLAVSYAVTGAATLSGSTLTITGTGSVTVTATQAGNADYAAAASVSETFTVAKAVLTVTASNVSVPYGHAIPTLTYTTAGFVNGDTSSVLSGSVSEMTSAQLGSAVGTYPISLAQGTLTAINYTFTLVNGTLTITSLGTASTPAFSPAAGSYTSAQSVTISEATAGATIYYTTDGSTPTTSSTRYAGAISVSASETIKAIANASGYSTSPVATAGYIINIPVPVTAATPVFSPPGGTYNSVQTVTISDSTQGATIYYTTDGSTPTASSSKYSSALTVSATETVQAIAIATGDTNSGIANATYTIDLPAATFTLGASPATQSVTEGQSAKYTLTVTPQNNFTQTVTFSCPNISTALQCSFAPATVTPAGAPVTSTLTVSTSPTSADAHPGDLPPWKAATTVIAMTLVLWPSRRRRRQATVILSLLLMAGVALTGCGTSAPAAKSQTYTVAITTTSGALSQTSTVSLKVTN